MPDKYDVFLSSPMSAFHTDDSYKKDRDAILKLKNYLEGQKNAAVYYAGEHISSSETFIKQYKDCNDFEAIENSKLFIMFYPEGMASSTLVEAGYALALKKPSIYFAHDKETLPFLLKAATIKYPNVESIEYITIDHAIEIISRWTSVGTTVSSQGK